MVYDITKQSSFESIEKWLNELKDHADPNITVILVGNKTDLKHIRAVKQDDGRRMAKVKRLAFLETSALDASNVE